MALSQNGTKPGLERVGGLDQLFGCRVVDSVPMAMGLLFLGGICAMAVPPIIATIPLDMRLPPREVAVAIGLTRTLFPISATIGPLIVGVIVESTGSLFVGLMIVSPMAITLFIGGWLMPETGPKGSRVATRSS